MEKTEKQLMDLDLSKFSLIYPDEETQNRHYRGEDSPKIDMFVLEELGLLEVFNLKNSDLDEYFTNDPKVIEHRMSVFEDMLAFPEISVTLNKLIPVLTDIMELRRLEADTGDAESYLESITEIELYISSITTLHTGFAPIMDKLSSTAFKTLAKRIDEKTGVETKFARLAHIVRGGSPTLRDRLTATRMGAKAVDLLLEGKSNLVVSCINNLLSSKTHSLWR